MAISHEYEYFKPKLAKEALEILRKYKNKASILAGGTDLVVWLKEDFIAPEALIDIKCLPGLNNIELKSDTLSIGALVTFNELIDSEVINEKFPLIKEMSLTVASTGIRNRATMVGNICAAVPCCDSGPVLLVYDAEIHLLGPKGESKIPISEWFLGPKKTSREADEFVTGISLKLPKEKHEGAYVKLGRYKGEDLAQASVAVLSKGSDLNVAFGAVAPKPIRSSKIEKELKGQKLSKELIQKALSLVPSEISPITDIRATKEYRLEMVKVMLERALLATESRLSGAGPEYGAKHI